MPAPSYLSPPSLLHHTTTSSASASAHLLSGGRNRRRSHPRRMAGTTAIPRGISLRIYSPRYLQKVFVLKYDVMACTPYHQVPCFLKPRSAMATATEGTSRLPSWLRGDTRKKQTAFLLRTLLFMCVAFRVAAALIRVLYRVAVGSVLGVASVLFAAANERCLRWMNQAALDRSVTGFFVGAMAHSWRVLMQGLTSLMFLCARADEYVRPPPNPVVLTPHDKPAAHPQQVHISTVGNNKMRISWVTDDRNAPSVVEYGKSRGNYTASATGEQATYRYFLYKSGAIHHVTIGPLAPSTTYHYRCGKAGDEFTLRTPPASLPIELVVIGDLGQTGWTASTLSHIGGADYDMLLLPGDLSYADTQQPLWDSFGRLVQPLASARPWMVTEGNHEAEALPVVGFAPFAAYNTRWRMPHEESGSASNLYYSFDVSGGAAHVVMLGSYAEFEAGSEQYAWLERDLAGVDRRRTPWLVVLLHAPWYNTNLAHQGEGEAMRAAMERLLYDARVDVVFSGHVHAYERFTRIYDNEADDRGPMYITIGDGGNREGLALRFDKDHKSAHLSVFQEASFGHGRLKIVNERSAVWTWHRNDDEYATVRDEVWLESLASPKLSMATAGRHDEEL